MLKNLAERKERREMEKKLMRILGDEGIEITEKEAKQILKLSPFDDRTFSTEPICKVISKDGKQVHVNIEHVGGGVKDVELADD